MFSALMSREKTGRIDLIKLKKNIVNREILQFSESWRKHLASSSIDKLIQGIKDCDLICANTQQMFKEDDSDVEERYNGFINQPTATRDSDFLQYRYIGFELVKEILRREAWESLIPLLQDNNHFLASDFLLEYLQVFSDAQSGRQSLPPHLVLELGVTPRSRQAGCDLIIGEGAIQEMERDKFSIERFYTQYRNILSRLADLGKDPDNESSHGLDQYSCMMLWDMILRDQEKLVQQELEKMPLLNTGSFNFFYHLAGAHRLLQQQDDSVSSEDVAAILETLKAMSDEEGLPIASLWLGLVYRSGIRGNDHHVIMEHDAVLAKKYFQKWFLQGGGCFVSYFSAQISSVPGNGYEQGILATKFILIQSLTHHYYDRVQKAGMSLFIDGLFLLQNATDTILSNLSFYRLTFLRFIDDVLVGREVLSDSLTLENIAQQLMRCIAQRSVNGVLTDDQFKRHKGWVDIIAPNVVKCMQLLAQHPEQDRKQYRKEHAVLDNFAEGKFFLRDRSPLPAIQEPSGLEGKEEESLSMEEDNADHHFNLQR